MGFRFFFCYFHCASVLLALRNPYNAVNHYLKRNKQGKHASVALKIDMSKAYDRMEWIFLCDMMLSLGFHHLWVQRVMVCVTLVKYHVLQNGGETRPHSSGNGLKARGFAFLVPFYFMYRSVSFSLCATVFYMVVRWNAGLLLFPIFSSPTIVTCSSEQIPKNVTE